MFGFFLRRAAALCAAVLAPTLLCAQNTSAYDRVAQLVAEQNTAQALELAEEALAKTPQDPQWLYLKALSSLPERTDQAQALLEALVMKHPELPEPHNALAVLHASKAAFSTAQNHLQQALAQRPEYRQALENLGDVHLAMAWQAYQAAQQQPGSNLAPKISWIEQQLRWVPLAKVAPANPAPSPTTP